MKRDGVFSPDSPVFLARRLGALLTSAFLLLLASPRPALAVAWSRTYGGAMADEAFSGQQTTDGGYVVAGRTASSGAGGDDGWILKLDALGNVQWEQTFGGAGNEEFHSVFQTGDGGYVVSGATGSFNGAAIGAEHVWVIKLTAAGAVQWQVTLGGNCLQFGRSVKELSGGGYIVAGNTCSFGVVGTGDGWVINLDPNGNLNWANTFDLNSGVDTFFAIDEDTGGGFVVAGETDGHMSVVPGDNDFWVLGLNGAGGPVWQWHAGGAVMGNSGDSARALHATSDGGSVVTGDTVLGSGVHDFWIIKLSAQGQMQWHRFLGFAGISLIGKAVRETSDGGYIVGGYRVSGATDGILLRLDGSGNQLWQRAHGSANGLAQFNDVKEAADGGFVAVGHSNATGNQDLWVVKTDHNGEINPGCTTVTPSSLTFAAPGLIPTSMTMVVGAGSVLTSMSSTAVGAAGLATLLQHCPATVRVNQDLTTDAQHEVRLAVDPNNVSSQVTAYIDDPHPSMSGGIQRPDIGISFTADGGATWTDRQVDFGCDGLDNDFDGPIDEETLCDGLDDDMDAMADEDPCCVLEHFHPSVVPDLAGRFYAGYLAQNPGALTGSGTSVIGAAKSTDGGNTWTDLTPALYVPFGPDLLPPFGFPDPVVNLDNPGLTVDLNPGMPSAATLMAVWQRENTANALDTDVYASSLASGASTWTTPVRVNDLTLACAELPVASWSAGHLWVAWRQSSMACGTGTGFFVDLSFDNGQTFNTFGPDLAGPLYTRTGMLRNHTFQPGERFAFAADPLNPNVLYLAYAEDPSGVDEADIMFTKSINGGNMWETPVRVNDDSTVTPQYAPSISIKVNANSWTLVDVTWYDERNSIGCNGLDDDGDTLIDEERLNGMDDDGDTLIDEDLCGVHVDVYLARTPHSFGGFTLFGPSVQVTPSPFSEPTTPFPMTIGEYLGTGSDSLHTYAAWADTRNGDNDILYSTVTDLDSDGDRITDGIDCAPADPGLRLRPTVVKNLTPTLAMSGNVTLSWTSQDPQAGSSTRYDIVTGLLGQLTADGDYRSSSCLVDDHPDTPYVDTRPNPPVGDAYYYLIRAVGCGSGTYDPSSPTDPRVGLEDGSASLPNPDPCP